MGTIRQDFFPGAPNKKNIHKGRRLFCEVKKNSIAPGVPKKDEYRLYFKIDDEMYFTVLEKDDRRFKLPYKIGE